MKKKKVIPIVIAIVVILALAVGAVFFFSQQTFLSSGQYVEYACDNTNYATQGYTQTSTDSNGCKIWTKDVLGGFIAYGMTASCYCGYGCQSNYPPCRTIPNTVLGGCKGYTEMCYSHHTDTRGGWIETVKTCTYEANDLLAVETFTGGQAITKYSMRYPVKTFCKAHPAIIMDSATSTSSTSTVVYDLLNSSQSVDIPQTQTMTIYYIMENNFNLPTQCKDNNQALNTKTNQCVSALGIVYFCSEGQFDPAIGACVVQPESKAICAVGVYNVVNKSCDWFPPTQAVCEQGFYSVDSGTCKFSPEIEYICPIGSSYNTTGTDNCEFKPTIILGVNNTKKIFCDLLEGFTFNDEKNTCEADIEKVRQYCIDGTLVFDSVRSKYDCTIIPETLIKCPVDYPNYDVESKKCVRYAKVNESSDPVVVVKNNRNIFIVGLIAVIIGLATLIIVAIKKRK